MELKTNQTTRRAAAILAALLILTACFTALFTESAFAAGKEEDKELVGFTVYYQNTKGEELADPQIFYGNEGDKLVVKAVSVSGYEPEVEKITKTLSGSEDDNVFTFVYQTVIESMIDGGANADAARGRKADKEEKDLLDLDSAKAPLAPPGEAQAKVTGNNTAAVFFVIVGTVAAISLLIRLIRRKRAK